MACLFIFIYFSEVVSSQVPQKHFNPDSLTQEYFSALKKEFGSYKKIPPVFEKPILIALSYYPELKNTAIRFRINRRHTPLQTRSTWGSLFKKKEIRDYVITISDSTESSLSPLLFKNVSFNAQAGAAGHELAHIADFSKYSFIQLIIHGIRNVSPKYLDRFEFKTDSICIAHGLGYQLLKWSENVRSKMNIINWRGPDYVHAPQHIERYMNPSTILQAIKANPKYLISY
ncbi:MAG: hypothetical protein ABIN97_05820 [Ginsengibacter sp.]